ncbi:MAG: lytic transglycosylase domain-containing protein [Pseudomonadota bacterium]
MFLLSVSAPSTATTIYFYRDNRGVLHFTDAPADARFQPFQVWASVRAGSGGVPMDPETLKPHIVVAADKYKLDPALIKAVIKVESAFDPHAVSWAGAQGLMQLMPDTAALMSVVNVFNPQENIHGGSRYLRQMLDRFSGDLNLALAAYNIGPERVAKENAIPNVRETQMYVKSVLHYYRLFKNQK